MKRTSAKATTLAAIAALACLALAGCDTSGLDDDSTKTLGLALGILVVLASSIGLQLQNRHYGKKRRANAAKNRKRAKQKKR